VALLRWLEPALAGDTEPVISSMTVSSSAPAGYLFPREVIAVAVRWYLRYGLSYATSKSYSPNLASRLIT
jgi:hypothetical protein